MFKYIVAGIILIIGLIVALKKESKLSQTVPTPSLAPIPFIPVATDLTAPKKPKLTGKILVKIPANTPPIFYKTKLTISPKQRVIAQYNQALMRIAQGQLRLALKTLVWISKTNPHFFPAQKALIILALKKHKDRLAQKLINHGLQYANQGSELLILKAQFLYQHHDVQQAITLLTRFNPPRRLLVPYYEMMGTLMLKTQAYPKALIIYQELIKIKPLEAKFWLGYAIALEHISSINKALQAYRKAQDLGGLIPELQFYLGQKVTLL